MYGHEDNDRSTFTYESNIFAFGGLFDSACFDGDNENISPNGVNGPVEDARRPIERCRAWDPPTMGRML
ncbi:hypothetical protein M378DRAFT_173637 [Amanita muscaria Koide BX008]|uniref:Uncharacterized protein n=1 Tax=Amanita muscaria (strain Koide BX008) TaxID=946122 RepID=A0A0C2W2Y4_AMAMK|nr:hypothetical protein M378DRAFT_173637 [Amanita muscaria Koide BX008]